MKKKILTAITICAIALITGCGSSGKSKSDFKLSDTTTFKQAGYTISIPDDWTKTNNANADLAFFFNSSRNDTFTESITTIIQDLSTYDYTLDSYKDLSISQYEDLGYKVKDCKKVKIDGKEFYSITSSTTNDKTKIMCKQLFTLRKKKAYLFTFAAAKDNYDKRIDEVNAIFDTIKLNNIKETTSEETTSENTSESTSEADTSAAE